MSRTNRMIDGDQDRLRQIAMNHAVDVTAPMNPHDTSATKALIARAEAIEAWLRHGGERVEVGTTPLKFEP